MAATQLQAVIKAVFSSPVTIDNSDGWNPPTPGSTIIASVDSNATVVMNTAGFTALPFIVDGNGAYAWYKENAAGTESSVTVTPSVGTDCILTVQEVGGLNGYDSANSAMIASTSGSTSGSAPVTPASDAAVFAFSLNHSPSDQNAPPINPVWTDGFTNVLQGSTPTLANTRCTTFAGSRLSCPAGVQRNPVVTWDFDDADRQLIVVAFALAAETTQVSSDLDLRWAVRNQVVSDLDLRWAVRNQVTSDLDLRWAVRSSVTSDLSLLWAVRNHVSKDLDLRWQVLSSSGTTPVHSDLTLKWKVYPSNPAPKIMRGPTLLRYIVFDFLQSAIPQAIDWAREQYDDLDEFTLPYPRKYGVWDETLITNDEYPMISMTVINDRNHVREEIDELGQQVYSPTYSCRFMVIARTPLLPDGKWLQPAKESAQTACQDLTGVFRDVVLNTPSFGRPDVVRMDESTVLIDYSEPVQIKTQSQRFIAAATITCEIQFSERTYQPPFGAADTVSVQSDLLNP